ncbi:MAG: hypothetical protein FGF48_08595 [Candidatus Brockarchaeota archaeon]|nr:hypothetical protein [Candidatus Brockarchaeota archaeon]
MCAKCLRVEENSILWRDEAIVGRVIYPYRIVFKPVFILDEDKWEKDKITAKDFSEAGGNFYPSKG